MSRATTDPPLERADEPEFPRRFVPGDADLGRWEDLEPLFDRLEERSIESPEELEEWLLDRSELAAAISEERADRYIAMTRDTGDEEAEAAYLHFIEEILPRAKPRFHALDRKYVHNPHRGQLDTERYRVLDRDAEADVELFRQENVPLQTEASKLSQRYQKVAGGMTVEFRGEERTLPQMGRYLEETEREARREAWELVQQRRLRERERFDELFDRLVELRSEIARNADLPDYRAYAWRAKKRFDYTPDDALRFHDAVEETFVPLRRRLDEDRRRRLGVEELRPWDLAVDPEGREPLRPFEGDEELADGVERILAGLDEELGTGFAGMRRRGELDLGSRKGKAPGGYLSTRDESRRPFIFMNAAGLHRDVETLLHESGHAFHSLSARREPLVHYRHAPTEFAEVASMTMELFALDRLEVFYTPEEADRARRRHLEGIVELLPWVATIDAFQHWIYTRPDHDREERTARWLELDERFGPAVVWDGWEAAREARWQRQLHLFCYPFYYLEYGIAQLGALQIWRRFREGPAAALDDYRRALALGGSRPLPELFEAAGAELEFSEATIRPLAELLERELSDLDGPD